MERLAARGRLNVCESVTVMSSRKRGLEDGPAECLAIQLEDGPAECLAIEL